MQQRTRTRGSIGAAVVSRRHLGWDGNGSTRIGRDGNASAEHRLHDVDVRGSAADESPVVPRDDSFRSPLASDRHDCDCCSRAEQHSTGADQHAGRLQLAARLPWHIRQLRDSGRDNHRRRFQRRGLQPRDILRTCAADKTMNPVQIDPATAVRFLETAFDADDWLAVFLKSNRTFRVAERIAPVSTIIRPEFQNWLCRENRVSANVYVSVNVLRARTASRRRQCVRAVRHVFLDVDRHLDAVIAVIAKRNDLAAPSYVLRTSSDRGHLLWRVSGFTVDDAESLQRWLAHELHTDRAATSCSQLTRLPGYLNHKRRPEYRVAVEYQAPLDVFYAPPDFPRPLQGVRRDRRTNAKPISVPEPTSSIVRDGTWQPSGQPSAASTAICTRLACAVDWRAGSGLPTQKHSRCWRNGMLPASRLGLSAS